MDVTYVDENDNEIGSGLLKSAIEKGIAVRIARVFLQNSQGKILIQKRSENHPWLPGRWDHSASGHVDAGETYMEAAIRELQEEVGITNVKLSQSGKFYIVERGGFGMKKSFNMIFIGKFEGNVKIDNIEVTDYRWASPKDIKKEIKDNPDAFTPGFIKAFRQLSIGNT